MTSSRPSPDGPARRIFYGRRQGRSLRPRQRTLLAIRLPEIEVVLPPSGAAGAEDALNLADMFGSAPLDAGRPIWLEIGFGDGGHLLDQARQSPGVGFIGCEPYVNGVAKLLASMEHLDREDAANRNIRIFPDDGRLLLAALPSNSVERAFLLFPDPWPKKRHRKRRFVSQETLDQLARVLTGGAEFRFATDHPEYCRWTLHRVIRHGAFDWLAEGPENWRNRPPDWPETRYEAKARAAGRKCYYLRFRRLSHPPGGE